MAPKKKRSGKPRARPQKSEPKSAPAASASASTVNDAKAVAVAPAPPQPPPQPAAAPAVIVPVDSQPSDAQWLSSIAVIGKAVPQVIISSLVVPYLGDPFRWFREYLSSPPASRDRDSNRYHITRWELPLSDAEMSALESVHGFKFSETHRMFLATVYNGMTPANTPLCTEWRNPKAIQSAMNCVGSRLLLILNRVGCGEGVGVQNLILQRSG